MKSTPVIEPVRIDGFLDEQRLYTHVYKHPLGGDEDILEKYGEERYWSAFFSPGTLEKGKDAVRAIRASRRIRWETSSLLAEESWKALADEREIQDVAEEYTRGLCAMIRNRCSEQKFEILGGKEVCLNQADEKAKESFDALWRLLNNKPFPPFHIHINGQAKSGGLTQNIFSVNLSNYFAVSVVLFVENSEVAVYRLLTGYEINPVDPLRSVRNSLLHKMSASQIVVKAVHRKRPKRTRERNGREK